MYVVLTVGDPKHIYYHLRPFKLMTSVEKFVFNPAPNTQMQPLHFTPITIRSDSLVHESYLNHFSLFLKICIS